MSSTGMACPRAGKAAIGLPVVLLGFSHCVTAVIEVTQVKPILLARQVLAMLRVYFVISVSLCNFVDVIAGHLSLPLGKRDIARFTCSTRSISLAETQVIDF
jgi:hypothetical protein